MPDFELRTIPHNVLGHLVNPLPYAHVRWARCWNWWGPRHGRRNHWRNTATYMMNTTARVGIHPLRGGKKMCRDDLLPFPERSRQLITYHYIKYITLSTFINFPVYADGSGTSLPQSTRGPASKAAEPHWYVKHMLPCAQLHAQNKT